MMINEVVFGLLIGLTSAVIYSLIQGIYFYFRWSKTRHFFTRRIREFMMYTSYHVTNILDINPIYDTEYENDHLMADEEFISEIESIKISKEQYRKINDVIRQTKNKIEEVRKEALSIPTYSSTDFHAIDNFMREIDMFLSSYSWAADDIHDTKTENRLKKKFIRVINSSKKNPFPNSFLDNVKNWYRRNSFKLKNKINRDYNKSKPFIKENLPF